ncbi:sensor histidine kinase [Gramella sp. KN1008]|uniref:sensor histidine kinase n=1 Tax=Gramella sp. KN1008 TaxID=2529298 RepID=UPI00103B6C49|nr:histidine kinase [Gramella sp. KN1008]TBW25885.1 hypothetical protein EZJ28_14730 [Gramella sp. KN1008]
MKFIRHIDLRLFVLIDAYYVIYILMAIVQNYYARYFTDSFNPRIGFGDTLKLHLLEFVLMNIYLILISIFVKKVLLPRFSWSLVIGLSLFGAMLFYFPFFIFLGFFEKVLFTSIEYEAILNSFDLLIINLPKAFIFISAFLFIILAYYYSAEVKIQEQTKFKFQNELLEMKLQVLNYQLKPHFLFNSINNIVSLIDSNRKLAKEALYDLSDFFRSVLKTGVKSKITLAEELKITDGYLKMMKLRFGKTLKISKKIEYDLLQKEVPAIILQPFIENAFKHGFTNNTLTIQINAYSEENNMILEILNNGKPLKANFKENGFGISITRQKLHNLYGTYYKMEFANVSIKDKDWVQVKISFPI